MEHKQRDWLTRILGAGLLLSAISIIVWQGAAYLSDEKADTMSRRMQAFTATAAEPSVISSTTDTAITTTINIALESTAPQTTIMVSQTTIQEEVISFPLELNAATTEELELLPGIGAVLAERIVLYRAQIDGFSNREQLLEVDGIGEAVLSQIYDLVYIANEIYSEPDQNAEPEEAEPEVRFSAEIPVETVEPTEILMVDLNMATKEELLCLPDMTPELADGILSFREEIEGFSSIYELLYLDGMTEAYFKKIRDYVQITCLEST